MPSSDFRESGKETGNLSSALLSSYYFSQHLKSKSDEERTRKKSSLWGRIQHSFFVPPQRITQGDGKALQDSEGQSETVNAISLRWHSIVVGKSKF